MKEEAQFLSLKLRTLWKEDRIMPTCRGAVRKANSQARPAGRDPKEARQPQGNAVNGRSELVQTPPGENSALLL